MGLRIRFQYAVGSNLGFSVERLADGLLFDFADSTFKAVPATTVYPLPEDSSPFSGRYRANLSNTPALQFKNGDYVVNIHDLNSQSNVVAILPLVMNAGDDASITASQSFDPWATVLNGNYLPGTAGYILSQYIDAKISTRSTFAGGPVASVMTPVVVGVVNDKNGYSLAPTGVDSILVETGINLRQSLSPILAATAGTLTGAGTGTIAIRGANTSVTRITASTDNAGNRSSVSLTLPT